MNVFKTKVRQAFRYWNRFGLANGSHLLANIALEQKYIQLPLRHYKAPVLARPNTSDVPVFEQVFVDREYDFPLPDLNPKLIIDAGANVGYAAVFFANKYPNARILAVEPESSNYELLVRNTVPYANITPINAALWNKTGHVAIDNPGAEKWTFRVTDSRSTTAPTVEALTVQDLLSIARSEHIDILKIDIEGSEKELFKADYGGWLERVSVMMIELHDEFITGCSKTFYCAVSQYNFNQFVRGENLILIKYV